MRSPHITIPDKVDKIIRDYAEKNNIKYSQAVARLVESGITNVELNKAVNVNNALMDKMYYKLDYNTKLLEQFYADMEIDDLINTNTSKGLIKFKKKYDFYKYDD